MNSDTNPAGKGDVESLEALKSKYGPLTCINPTKIEARSTNNGQIATSKAFPQTFATFDNTTGFSCINTDQPSSTPCQDYEVRLCCPGMASKILKSSFNKDFFILAAPEVGAKVRLTCNQRNRHFNYKDAGFIHSIDAVCMADG